MLLSEAILLGSVETGQAFRTFKDDNGNTCAWGAALTARGIDFHPEFGPYFHKDVCKTIIPKDWHWVFNKMPLEPESIWSYIAKLNDKFKWTRPQIAAWVAEKEKELGIVDTETKEEVKEGEYAPV